jgi:hypothetical protein
MYILLFMYPFLIGILLYFVFKSDFFTLLLFIVLWELFIFLAFRKLSFQPRPFERLSYNTALLIGYFYSMWMYGIVKFHEDSDSIL